LASCGTPSCLPSTDSGYFRGFEEFGNRFHIDYALIGAGAYEPRWFMHYSHMNVQEFFRASDELKAGVSIPIHFGVISLSDEPLVYPLYEIDKFLSMNREYAGKIKPLRVGEFLELF
jgi:N-acyl-phosphatidylethanolamine-hydrolysing phospholipase D